MDACLLCLECKKDTNGIIRANSEKWMEQNIKFLINKHLWPMEQITDTSWICKECGEVLQEFHQFYKRIELAQQNYATNLKLELESSFLEQKEFSDSHSSSEDCKNYVFERKIVEYNHVEPEITIENPLPTEYIAEEEQFIKKENQEDIKTENNAFKQTRKRGRPPKDMSLENAEYKEDPLKKSSKSKETKITSTKRKKQIQISEDNSSQDNCNDNIIDTKDNNSDSDTDNQDDEQMVKVKKKNHRNLDEKTLKEYDKIIADNFKIFCNICQHELDNFLALRRHFKMEHQQRGYARCCKRNFFTRSLLVDHIHVHQNPEHFKCQECGKVFSDRSRLQCHKKLHEDDSKLDKCKECGKLFADKGALKKHVLTHSSEKLFPCTICGKYFTNSFILNHHIEAVHENKFVQICDICGKSIRCPTAFASHMEKHEVKNVTISCDVCGLLLSSKEGLKRHKNSQHPEGGKKEHTCHICSKISPTQRALKSHIRSVHEQGFEFKCSLCEKSFKRPAVLREHMATHTGTALYTCPWCPRTFISNGNMYNHRKNAHPKEWEELKRQKYAGNI
ncbi:uncharacterized protein ACRADG_010504 [Cochliomyia hominivorax]